MTTIRRLTTIIEREGDGTVGWCPTLDIASQGDTVEAARANVQEAISLFLEVAPPEEVAARLKGEVFVTDVEVAFG
jgi:predicted RNase H-like HicB family nuclease